MDSAAGTPKGGFPHSDICGATVARTSPQLIAACHVLHRLLAPRHPPNALIALNNHHHPHAGPKPASPRAHQTVRPETCQPASRERNSSLPKTSSATHSHTHTNQSDSPVKQHAPGSHPITRRRGQAANPSCSGPAPRGTGFTSTSQPHLETVGIEPTTPCLQSRCSPTELRPLKPHGREGSS